MTITDSSRSTGAHVQHSRPDDMKYAKDNNAQCQKHGCAHVWYNHVITEPHECGISDCACKGFLPAYASARTEVIAAPSDDIPEGELERYPNWLQCDNLRNACPHPMMLHRYMGSLANAVGSCQGLRAQGGEDCTCKGFEVSIWGRKMLLCADCPHVAEFHVADPQEAETQICRYRGCTCKAFALEPAKVPSPGGEDIDETIREAVRTDGATRDEYRSWPPEHMEPGPGENTVLRERAIRDGKASYFRTDGREVRINAKGLHAGMHCTAQPKPEHIEGSASMHDLAIEILRERREFGLKKYGTILQVGNGRDWAKDVYEEAADQFREALRLDPDDSDAARNLRRIEDDLTRSGGF